MYKVRFHLANGPHKGFWQVKLPNGQTSYFDPRLVTLTMVNATLRCWSSTAKKIHNGGSKTVCAWIECGGLVITQRQDNVDGQHVRFNPRVLPHWTVGNGGQNANGQHLDYLITNETRVLA